MRRRFVKGTALAAAIALAAIFSLAGCAPGKKPPATEYDTEQFDPFEDPGPAEDYRIRTGDAISVHFLYNPELSVEHIQVREDGKASLPVVGDLLVAGKTSKQITEDVRSLYRDYVETSDHGSVIRAGDELQLRFAYNPQLNQRAYVRPDGKVSLLMLGELQADGVPFQEFEDMVSEGYAEYIREPEMSMYLLSTRTKKIYSEEGDITVLIASTQPKQVYVGGEVLEPTMIEFRDWLTPWQAIMQAQGLLPTADPKRAIHITRGPNGGAVATKIDLTAYLKGDKEYVNLYLRHGDVLLVPRSGIAKLNLFVEQVIRNTLPIRTSFVFSYLVNESVLIY